MASPDVAYAAAVLAIYLVLAIPGAYTAFKHGLQGMAWLGWGYFLIFCTVRIIGSALQISSPHSTAAAIISSVGLSPLTIAIGSVLHEARFYLLSLRDKPAQNKADLRNIILFHGLVAAGVALLAKGAVGLQSAKDQADPSKLNTDWHYAGIGGALILAAIALGFSAAVHTYLSHPRPGSGSNNTQQALAQRLVVAVIVACPLLAIRTVGSMVFYFDKNLDMSPLSGTWGFRVGLYLVPEVLSACALLAGGLVSRNVSEVRSGDVDAVKVSEGGHNFGGRGY